ncbi:MFS transporter [Amycolatopsis sp. KNN50.9b]|nr:MFS transporter [Amycolatopsis sp. KNN50.9b]
MSLVERHPLRWWGLAVTVLAVLVDMVDNQIVTVALPAIQRRLGAGEAALQWISAGYALGFALTLITGGRLGDRYGRKRLFLVGMTVFILASTGAGLAPGAGILIAARVVQGIGSGLMVPQVLSFIHAEFAEDERPKAMMYYSIAFPVGGIGGPLVGGLLTQANLFDTGWRAVFLVNVPFGVLAVVGALLAVPDRPGTSGRRLDLAGLALLTAGLFAIFYPLVQGREQGWPWWLVALVIAAVPLLALFAAQQRAAARRGGEPLIAPGLLRRRGLLTAQAVTFCTNTAVGVFFVLTLHLQLGLAYSPLATALAFVPAAAGIVVGNVVAMRLAPRYGGTFTAAGTVVMLAGLALIAVLVVRLGGGLSPTALLGPTLVWGLGVGGVLNSLFAISMSQVGPEQAGSASGVVNTTVQLGTAAGIALLGTVFFSRTGAGFAAAAVTAMAVAIGVLVLALLLTAALPRPRRGARFEPRSTARGEHGRRPSSRP